MIINPKFRNSKEFSSLYILDNKRQVNFAVNEEKNSLFLS